jgi:hypothetical protein
MTMRASLLTIFWCGLAGTLAACGNGLSGPATGALLAGEQAVAQPPTSQDDPMARALYAAAVSARATKCGFYFDPAKLKARFLAAETGQGTTPEELEKMARTYDFTRVMIAGRIAGEAEYCSEMKTREIKADLARHLAGNFSLPRKKVAADESWFGSAQAPAGREILNPEWIKDPQWTDRTKRVEE